MSKDAWHKIGHNGWAQVRPTPQQFEMQILKRAEIDFESAAEAAVYTAGLMQQQWNDKPWYLALSGGVDSEFVANVLLTQGIAFTPLILKIRSVNEIESWYAEYWCRNNNVEPFIVELEPKDMEVYIGDYVTKIFNTKQIGILTNIALTRIVEKLGGYCIFATGDINYDSDQKKFYCDAIDYVGDIYFAGMNPTCFFAYTPEMVLAYIHNFKDIVDEQLSKLSFYDVSPRPKINYLDNLWHSTPKLQKFADLILQKHASNRHCYFPSWQYIIDSLEPCDD